jgi:hypothetical protein
LLACLLAGCARQSARIGHESEARGAEPVATNQKAEAPSKGDSEFPFPPDKGGQLLADQLRPANQIPLLSGDGPIKQKTRPGPVSVVESPDLSLPGVPAPAPPSIPNPKARPVQPTIVETEPPLSRQLIKLADPIPVILPAGAKIRWPSPDINQPIPLPILARQVMDRSSLDDPSAEASQAAALAPKVPDRTTPAPFLRLNLPDPFEHRNVIRLRTPPPEITLARETPRLPGP